MSHLNRWRPPRMGCAWLATSIFLLAALPLATLTRAAEADDYQVKGRFLLNFARFVEWPQEGQVGLESEIRVCVLGDGEVSSALSKVLHGKSAGKKGVMVRRIEDLEGVAWCRIVFITRSTNLEPEIVVNSLGATSILTVGESDGFAANGGMVNFIGDRSEVRFEINQRAARRAGLKISSKLLRLAEVVED